MQINGWVLCWHQTWHEALSRASGQEGPWQGLAVLAGGVRSRGPWEKAGIKSPALKGQAINPGCFAGRVTLFLSFRSTMPWELASCQILMGACKQCNILIYLATGQISSLPS